ncbi:hypothetical protein P4B35_02840 [Pontiellaceae bacterium B12227]|nr:hypothetical protein [Pontiellaceae bacterium B12227]
MNRNSIYLKLSCYAGIAWLMVNNAGAASGAAMNVPSANPSMKEMLTDPEDGMLDMSEWLSQAKGFFPVPMIITEPAVGYGGGLTLIFIHDSIENRADEMKKRHPDGSIKRLPPPSVSGIFGLGTENGTWAAGGFHKGIWKEDTIRYTGVYAHIAPNYDFYGTPDSPLPMESIPVSFDSDVLFQQVVFRLGDSDFFAGTGYSYMNADAKLNTDRPLPPFLGNGAEITSASIPFILEYDSRDNMFTPDRGLNSYLQWSYFDEWLASDNRFDLVWFKNRYWHPVVENWVLGLRIDGEFSSGDIPFYMKPFVHLRGMPAMRRQGDHAITAEAELRWDFNPRWSAVGFAGAGWTSDDGLGGFGEAYPAGGFGLRYLFSKVYQLRAGIDVAFSEDESAFYITTGNAWKR